MEDSMLRDQIERYNQRLRDFEEKQRAYRQHQERPTDPDLEVRNRWQSDIYTSFQIWRRFGRDVSRRVTRG
jgi:hypothetical protein